MIRNEISDIYLLLIDLACMLLSYGIAVTIRFGKLYNVQYILQFYGIRFLLITSLYIVTFSLMDSHRKFLKRKKWQELLIVGKENFTTLATLAVVIFIFKESSNYSRFFVFSFVMINIVLTFIVRLQYKEFLLTTYKGSPYSHKIMVLTTSDQTEDILESFNKNNPSEDQITYLTIWDRNEIGKKIRGIEVRANCENCDSVAAQEVVDSVFISLPEKSISRQELERLICSFQDMGITVHLCINTFGLKVREKVVNEISEYHVLTYSAQVFSAGELFAKRLLDLAGGVVGCLLMCFMLVFLGPAIRLDTPGPIFYSQTRIGKNGRRFKIYKFRSMYQDAEKHKKELMEKNEIKGLMFKLREDPRVTRIGKFLRETSLDEFPQFLNVLKGDMSLVGTRPPTETEFLQYECRHKRRLAIKPGITGLWQVSGRSDISDFEDVVRLDLEYIDHWSFKSDIKILLKTIYVVFLRIGSH